MNIKANNWTVDLDVLAKLQKDGWKVQEPGYFEKTKITINHVIGTEPVRRSATGSLILYRNNGDVKHLDTEFAINYPDLAVSQWYNDKILAVRQDEQISEKLNQPVEKIKEV